MKILRNWSIVLAACAMACVQEAGATGGVGENRAVGEAATVGDPVSAADGAFSTSFPLLDLGGPMGLAFVFHYNQSLPETIQMMPVGIPVNSGYWWSPLAGCALFTRYAPDSTCSILLDDGSQVAFRKTDGLWVQEETGTAPLNYALQVQTDGANRLWLYLMDPVAERLYIFDSRTLSDTGDLRYFARCVIDRNGHRLDYRYDDTQRDNPVVTNITDNLGRSLAFTYENDGMGNPCLTAVTDQAGRTARFLYETDAPDYPHDNAILRAIVQPDGGTNRLDFTWLVWNEFTLDGNLVAVTYPRGNAPVTNRYGVLVLPETYGDQGYARVTNQVDALGHGFALAVDTNDFRSTATFSDGTQAGFFQTSAFSFPTQMLDACGHAMRFEQDAQGRPLAAVDRAGGTSSFAYDTEAGFVSAATNAVGAGMQFEYETVQQSFTNPVNAQVVTFSFRQLKRVLYPDESFEEYARDGRGNVTEQRDRDGHVWSYAYDNRGMVTNQTNPDGGFVACRYDAAGRLAGVRDSETGEQCCLYDEAGRLVSIVTPDGATYAWGLDAMDRMTAFTNASGAVWTFAYDANGNRTSVSGPNGGTQFLTYDILDRQTVRKGRTGGETSCAYDGRGRLATLTDAGGRQTSYGFDARGWTTNLTVAGRSWSYVYDREGVLTRAVTPLGHATAFGVDGVGRVTSVTNALGHAAQFTYDALGRLTIATDPLGRAVTNDYDAWGRRVRVADRRGEARYAYDALGALTNIADLAGQSWRLSRTVEGRLRSLTDPLGGVSHYGYDVSGRLSVLTNASGQSLTYQYDAAGRVTNAVDSTGSRLAIGYDAEDQVVIAAGETFAYDLDGRMTNQCFADGARVSCRYDAAGLMTNVCLPGGVAVSYEYDDRHLLSEVRDNLGTVLLFSHDDDGRLTTIARPGCVDSVYGWNAAGCATSLQHGAIAAVRRSLDAAGGVTAETRTQPLEPAPDVAQQQSFTYDAASRIASPGYACDAAGRVTNLNGMACGWDAWNRLARAGATSFSYTARGRLAARRSGGATNRFYHAEALGGVLVAEAGEGAVSRCYVHTPSGRLLYRVDTSGGGEVHHYLFDLSGNAMALVTTGGVVAAAYALDPYGVPLAQSGLVSVVDQPFTFGGERGVRREGGDGLYLAGARWYDARTARFLSPEPVWPDPGAPALLNPFQYALGDPVSRSDADGRQPRYAGMSVALAEARRLHGTYQDAEKGLETRLDGIATPFARQVCSYETAIYLMEKSMNPPDGASSPYMIGPEPRELDAAEQEERRESIASCRQKIRQLEMAKRQALDAARRDFARTDAYLEFHGFMNANRGTLAKLHRQIEARLASLRAEARRAYLQAGRRQKEEMVRLYRAGVGQNSDHPNGIMSYLEEQTSHMLDGARRIDAEAREMETLFANVGLILQASPAEAVWRYRDENAFWSRP